MQDHEQIMASLRTQAYNIVRNDGWKGLFQNLDQRIVLAACVWVRAFNKDPKYAIDAFKRHKSPGYMVIEAYNICVQRKLIDPFPDTEEMNETAVELFGGNSDRVKKIIWFIAQASEALKKRNDL